jgi:folate-binding protein YgfZ
MKFNVLQGASAAFRIRGPDANTFLSGQFTQELRVSPGRSAYGLWLSQKGKVLADSDVLRLTEEEHLVFAASADAMQLRQRWEDYLIADEVTIEDECGAWAAALAWDFAAGELEQLAPSAAENRFVQTEGAFVFPAWGGRGARWWFLFRASARDAWSERLAAVGREVDGATVTQERILAGVPAVPQDIGPDELPNEGGLEASAISFTKGCYLGQEVMARLKNLGQVRRRLHVIRGTGAVPAAKTPLFQGVVRVGETRSAAADGVGFVAFALLSLVNLNPSASLRIGEGGATAEICDHG